MATQVIYARVPEDIKQAADAYAAESGVSLTAAVVDLLDQGLAAASAEMSVEDLRGTVNEMKAEKRQMAADLRAATGELSSLRSLADRARKSVGTCVKCAEPVTGYDLLAAGQCSNCGEALPDLWTVGSGSVGKTGVGAAKSFNEHDVLLLLGAVGAVVGVAYLASKSGT